MKKLDEKRTLLNLARALGQEPDPDLIAQVNLLEQREARIRGRVRKNMAEDLKDLGQLKNTQPPPIKNPLDELRDLFASLKPLPEAQEYKRLDHYPDGKPIPDKLPDLYQHADNKMVPAGQNCHNCAYMQENGGCSLWGGAQVRADYWCAKWKKQEKKDIKEEVLITPAPAETVVETTVERVAKTIKETVVSQGEPVLAQSTNSLELKVRQLEAWISRIAATGPGGGEVNLRWLDDVARDTIADGRWLKYDGPSKKFVFDEINPYEVIYNTTQVTSATYTVQANDFYLGVNYAGPVTITLPASTNSGRMLIIKDEDGDASTNPITVTGTVDNDAGGFIIQLDNGAIQLIYRNGWRIV